MGKFFLILNYSNIENCSVFSKNSMSKTLGWNSHYCLFFFTRRVLFTTSLYKLVRRCTVADFLIPNPRNRTRHLLPLSHRHVYVIVHLYPIIINFENFVKLIKFKTYMFSNQHIYGWKTYSLIRVRYTVRTVRTCSRIPVSL